MIQIIFLHKGNVQFQLSTKQKKSTVKTLSFSWNGFHRLTLEQLQAVWVTCEMQSGQQERSEYHML